MRWLCFLILVLSGLSVAAAADRRPNVVLFLADDLGWTGLNCYGSDFYETPNLDRLAAEGIRFTDAYSACTVCSPSRAAILTGKYPARLRLTNFIPGQVRPFAQLQDPKWQKWLKHEEVTLPEALVALGYETGHVGKWHLERRDPGATGYGPLDHGFEWSVMKPEAKGYFLKEAIDGFESGDYLTDFLAAKAAGMIEEWGKDPFFLYFAFHVPHTPIQGRADLVAGYRELVNPDAIHRNPVYAAMVQSMDEAVGTVVSTLERAGVVDETLIIFTSDNGGLTQRYGKHDGFTENLPLRRGKGSAYEGGVRVPLIIRWPGVVRGGETCDEPIIGIDFFPTILEVAGAEKIPRVDGMSLRPLLEDPAGELDREAIYWHFPHYHAGGDGPYRAIRSRDWRLVEFFESGNRELYNLKEDLAESENLLHQEEEVAARLGDDLARWLDQVGAQMPWLNPEHDPARASEVAKNR